MNFSNHGAYCGQSFRVGAGAALGDLKGMPHGKPDWDNARFGLFIGAAPAQAGNPFQRQARQLAEARVRPDEDGFTYVVVSPILPASSSLSAGPGNEWLPVNPAGDLALAMGLIDRWPGWSCRTPPAVPSASARRPAACSGHSRCRPDAGSWGLPPGSASA